METAKETITVKTPWIKNLGDVPAHLEYPEWSMAEGVEHIAEKYPNLTAYVFMGVRPPIAPWCRRSTSAPGR